MLKNKQQGVRSVPTLDFVQNSVFDNKTAFKESCIKKDSNHQFKVKSTTTYGFYEKKVQPYIKITLKITEEILLYETCSMTALRDTCEGGFVEEDNKKYEHLLSTKTKALRTVDMETQTRNMFQKSRDVNTIMQKVENVGSYVSKFDMYDTYKFLETSTESVAVNAQQKINVTTYTVHGIDKFIGINQSMEFTKALMITMRILAGNVFEKQQRRFRNMEESDPMSSEVHYLYRLQLLWINSPPSTLSLSICNVSDISWCPGDGDIYAVAYGELMHNYNTTSRQGCVSVWNIKNPVNPERNYFYDIPVVSVEFSPFIPNLLAIGLYDGTIEVRDIANTITQDLSPLAVSQRNNANSCDPISAIKWIPNSNTECIAKENKIEPFLALSRDSVVTKYTIINSPTLMGFQQIRLESVEGMPEGLAVPAPFGPIQAGRPQGLNLCVDPVNADIYYVLTDNGCVHKCSTNYPQQHLEVRQVYSHVACNAMEFSSWSPKLYLTCGNDWNVRVWIIGISRPLITLEHKVGPIYNACWSKTHSTIIITIGQKTISVWDISRRTLKPMSTTNTDEFIYTIFKISNCGFSLAVGTQRGDVLLYALEDLPFQPHFQYEKLESAIIKAISNDIELTNAVKSLGNFGYKKMQ